MIAAKAPTLILHINVKSIEADHGLQSLIQHVALQGVLALPLTVAMVSVSDWFGNRFKTCREGIFMAILYHNPRCSKSRQAVALCTEANTDVAIHLYRASPLDYETIFSLLSRLDGDISKAIRWNDKAFKELESPEVDETSIESVSRFLSHHGHLMERPWLDVGTSTRIGRPVETLSELLQ
tara:strand:- start:115 stop:657 length:543 start_codon:yes stop_codon:yes gene_type:complete